MSGENTYKKIINSLPNGFACYRLIKDNDGQLIDLITLEMNEAYKQIMGLDDDVIGKLALEHISISDKRVSAWVNTFTNIIAAGGSNTIEHYAEEVDRWFLVTVSSYEVDHFAVLLHDITMDKLIAAEKNILKDEYETIFNNTQDAMFLIDVEADNKIQFRRLNHSHEKATGLTTEMVCGKSPKELFGEEMGTFLEENYMRCVRSKKPISYEETLTLLKGTKIWMTMLSPIIQDGKVVRIVGAARDITDMKKAEEQLYEEKERLDITLESIGDGVITTSIDGEITLMNKAAQNITEYKPECVLGKSIEHIFNIQSENTNLILGEALQKIIDSGRTTPIFNDTLLITKNGNERRITGSGAPIRDMNGNILGIVITFRDETEELKNKEQLIYLNFHDQLTGLYNRTYFDEELKRLDTESRYPISIIVGDVNGLKLSNDVFGHTEGDRLLIAIAKIMKESCRYEDIIARWGGDEFSIILPSTTYEEAVEVCKRIKERCEASEPIPIKPSIALGTATKVDQNQSINKILSDAENIMYRNKLKEGKKVQSDIIFSLQNRLQDKSIETIEHCERMRKMVQKLRQFIDMSDKDYDALSIFAILHDIGNIVVPKSILQKPGELDNEEWLEIKRHPETGFRVAQSTPEFAHIADLILSHHERWDGNGYPQGLKGEQVPRLSRILALMDAYDVMTHDRPYRKAMTHTAAIDEIRRCSDTQFDPQLSELFIIAVNNSFDE